MVEAALTGTDAAATLAAGGTGSLEAAGFGAGSIETSAARLVDAVAWLAGALREVGEAWGVETDLTMLRAAAALLCCGGGEPACRLRVRRALSAGVAGMLSAASSESDVLADGRGVTGALSSNSKTCVHSPLRLATLVARHGAVQRLLSPEEYCC